MRRLPASLSVIGAGCGVVGLALLLVEVVRALSGQSLGGVSVALLWTGVGLLVAGMALVVLSLLRDGHVGDPDHLSDPELSDPELSDQDGAGTQPVDAQA